MSRKVTFRPAEDSDLEFLCRVYASTREEELRQVPWTDDQKETFVRMQFQAQHDFYHQQWPDARYDVVLLGEEPVGRLYVDRRPHEIRIIDIALLSESRGAGIGGSIIRDLLEEGRRTGLPVNIHVLQTNLHALRFYKRLGFREVAAVSAHVLMQSDPSEGPRGD